VAPDVGPQVLEAEGVAFDADGRVAAAAIHAFATPPPPPPPGLTGKRKRAA
jgi:hypothetical protein